MKKSSTLATLFSPSKQTFNSITKNDYVLLVDGNDIDLFINQKVLELLGITNVTAFSNADEALVFLNQTTITYRLILIDIYLPTMDGFEFINAFKKLNLQNKHQEICLLSATINPTQIQQSINYQIKFIEKPLSVEKLHTFPSF